REHGLLTRAPVAVPGPSAGRIRGWPPVFCAPAGVRVKIPHEKGGREMAAPSYRLPAKARLLRSHRRLDAGGMAAAGGLNACRRKAQAPGLVRHGHGSRPPE